jgi:hypothetical protein
VVYSNRSDRHLSDRHLIDRHLSNEYRVSNIVLTVLQIH